MGRPDASKGGKTLAVSITEGGQVDYEAIVRQGANKNKIIHSEHKALIPKLDELDPKVRASHGAQRRPAAGVCTNSTRAMPVGRRVQRPGDPGCRQGPARAD
jgi:hypothetical protein